MGRRTGQALSEQVETMLGDEVHPRVAPELKRSPTGGGVPLSGRELEVGSLVGSGATNAEIASALYISVGTTRNHVSRVLRKLSLWNRTQLAIFAVERGWSQRR